MKTIITIIIKNTGVEVHTSNIIDWLFLRR